MKKIKKLIEIRCCFCNKVIKNNPVNVVDFDDLEHDWIFCSYNCVEKDRDGLVPLSPKQVKK